MAASAVDATLGYAIPSQEIPIAMDMYNQWLAVQFTFPNTATMESALTINVNVGQDSGMAPWVGDVYLDDVIVQ